jgi:hypothetical protein
MKAVRRCRRLPPADLRSLYGRFRHRRSNRSETASGSAGRWRSPLRYTSSTAGSALSSGASAANVSYGSFTTDAVEATRGCRSAVAPKADKQADVLGRPLCANRDLTHCSKEIAIRPPRRRPHHRLPYAPPSSVMNGAVHSITSSAATRKFIRDR